MRKALHYISIGTILVFALIGFVFTSVFIGMRFGLFNVRGSIDARNASLLAPIEKHGGQRNPANALILPGTSATNTPITMCQDGSKHCDWDKTHEWAVVSGGLTKDQLVIDRVAQETGVSPRLIASIVVPEQTRFFTADREVFKRYFEPLKILGSLTQFSLGVSGVKQQTASDIERFANDPTSPFYPGPDVAPLLAYAPNANHDAELYDRLSDAKEHYYSYLYTAAFIREIEAQWTANGQNIGDRPGAIVTLFNIGFNKSHPNPNPQLGGAPIDTGGQTYSYGQLGQLFYDSNELTNVFPK